MKEVTVTVINPDDFVIRLPIPEAVWAPVDAESYGDGWITIDRYDAAMVAGQPFHIFGIKVEKDEDGDWHAACNDLEGDFQDLLNLAGGCNGGEFRTIQVQGGEYIVHLYPFFQ